MGHFLFAQLPVGHGQEEPAETVAALAKVHRFPECLDGRLPFAVAIVGHAQGIPEVALVRRERNGLLGEFDG